MRYPLLLLHFWKEKNEGGEAIPEKNRIAQGHTGISPALDFITAN